MSFWPDRTRPAMSFVVNVEEGAEASVADGDKGPEPVDELAIALKKPLRNLANESNYRYGLAGDVGYLKEVHDKKWSLRPTQKSTKCASYELVIKRNRMPVILDLSVTVRHGDGRLRRRASYVRALSLGSFFKRRLMTIEKHHGMKRGSKLTSNRV